MMAWYKENDWKSMLATDFQSFNQSLFIQHNSYNSMQHMVLHNIKAYNQ